MVPDRPPTGGPTRAVTGRTPPPTYRSPLYRTPPPPYRTLPPPPYRRTPPPYRPPVRRSDGPSDDNDDDMNNEGSAAAATTTTTTVTPPWSANIPVRRLTRALIMKDTLLAIMSLCLIFFLMFWALYEVHTSTLEDLMSLRRRQQQQLLLPPNNVTTTTITTTITRPQRQH